MVRKEVNTFLPEAEKELLAVLLLIRTTFFTSIGQAKGMKRLMGPH